MIPSYNNKDDDELEEIKSLTQFVKLIDLYQ
jgi:hypothetical protein